VILKYTEELPDISAARKREAEIKTWTRKQKLALFEVKKYV
jgi:predicted GIY-YIG superfamily endonuclease